MANRPHLQHKTSEPTRPPVGKRDKYVEPARAAFLREKLLALPVDVADAAHVVAELLGRSLPRSKGPLGPHELIKRGLPASSLKSLQDHFPGLEKSSLFKALGISGRTVHRKGALKPLSPEQSGRAWKVAAILAKATGVFGSRERAEQWFDQPTAALDGERPIALLETIPGAETVEKYLGRLEHGVYT